MQLPGCVAGPAGSGVGGCDDDLTNILNSLLDHNDIVDLMADVAATQFPPPPNPMMQQAHLRQVSPEFQFPPAVAVAAAAAEIPLVVSDPYLFEMPSGQQSSMAPPPQMTVFWKGEQQPAKKGTSR